jgi:hypothetical protein
MFRNPECMDQRSIVLYLNRKGRIAQIIHDVPVAMLWEEAIADGTMMKYIPEARAGPDNTTSLPEEMSAPIHDSDVVIVGFLEEFSVSSVQHLL